MYVELTATPSGTLAPVMKRWLTPLPLRFARPIVPVLLLAQYRYLELAATPPGPSTVGAGSPVDVVGGDGHHARADTGDEALGDARAVEVGAPDRAAVGVGPVDVRARVRAG